MEIAKVEEFQDIRDFYWEVIDLMSGRSDSVGWLKGIYPSDELLRDSLNRQELYVLRENGKLVSSGIVNSDCNEGYDGVSWGVECLPDDVFVLHALAVHPRVQGKGIGKLFVREVISLAEKRKKKAIRLDVLGRNIVAEKLYSGLGFKLVSKKKMYYADTGWTEFLLFEFIL